MKYRELVAKLPKDVRNQIQVVYKSKFVCGKGFPEFYIIGYESNGSNKWVYINYNASVFGYRGHVGSDYSELVSRMQLMTVEPNVGDVVISTDDGYRYVIIEEVEGNRYRALSLDSLGKENYIMLNVDRDHLISGYRNLGPANITNR